ncbi:hypothetical protein LCI18_010687 [Fusarium solani-melongenae]|uniref:Uncharacterized protein n=1 Tax=Fusarium solani subsp. cucurbitae TaxID=2747967 RepID=A0ACD3ZEW1_FUSSC|nr:hypothetical protein LCI18_010687 [Fusarium solani-melongenae]
MAAPYANDHLNPNGPNDARPTALKVIRDEGLDGKLTGKVFLITGCTSGVGVEIARAIHATGADVYITGRQADRRKEVANRILADGKPGKIVYLDMSLNSIASVKKAAANFLELSKTLNVLICNAGIALAPQGTTGDGHETHFGVNYVAHFALSMNYATPFWHRQLLMTTSSMVHAMCTFLFHDYNFERTPYEPYAAYGSSKTATLWMANEIERRYGSKGLHATSVHPGAVLTEKVTAQMERSDGSMQNPALSLYMKSIAQGAATTVWAAVGKEWENKGGRYLAEVSEDHPLRGSETDIIRLGYASHAYDEDGEKRLWQLGLKLIGAQDEA